MKHVPSTLERIWLPDDVYHDNHSEINHYMYVQTQRSGHQLFPNQAFFVSKIEEPTVAFLTACRPV